ncbi:DUF4982 domain-containing protein [Gilvimarinus agarilyticus]|uniref:glycoside hydrolase family 2 TIM barrel-domain containing protein n=1 Tax=Gilvimarinus sp. 2_MG-2023 TaxID=3062666 RepID=UPI001C0878A9|nr:glycoside hydrolase family 2 TIM barrel-domain containing protein [Gilvimarinus sp. 2_MG-2023]MBU2887717.1 DUF4982 domain-containing protein [Gilvimarinus agarilyticus]MDO6572364.1 glycoside hydrolase family 2 TIM barrel-domain containing protein [Gilvimarinus sp. 2_MG-2023]
MFTKSSLIMLLLLLSSIAFASEGSRAIDFNFDWKFTLVESTDLPSQVPLNDDSWRNIRLPHDWSVELDFDPSLEGATGYLPGGVGVYQKHFPTPSNVEDKTTYIVFDGVYNNSTYWLNGKLLGENPYGYSPVYFDLSAYLKKDGSQNVLTVHVDHSRYVDSRWYTGSGIYRNVNLVVVDKLHIPVWGTYVTTPEITEKSAKVAIEIDVRNNAEATKKFSLSTKIVDASGAVVSSTEQKYKVGRASLEKFEQELTVFKPKFWDIDHPNMYKAVTSLSVDGKLVDEYETPFGFRTIKFEAKKGFWLNGKPVLMKGVSLHHDGGLVGSAVPKGVWKRRLESLKEAGVNAIRTAHNPFSEEFLDLCDEMGFLVQHEIFDEFDYPKDKRLNYHDRHDDNISRGYDKEFHEWAKNDLERTLLRDRNHPSIVQWSIGNEIEWAYVHYRYVTGFWPDPDDATKVDESFWGAAPKFTPQELKERYNNSPKQEYILAETAKRINAWVKELDTTRPTTANLILPQVSHVSGYADAVDIVGYSYRNSVIPWAHKHFPEKQVTINENPGRWDDWRVVLNYPGVFSQFMWTGIDYIGERHNKWPEKSGWGDILDLAGFKNQGWNYFKSIFVNEPHISLGTLPLEESGFNVDDMTGLAVEKDQSSYHWRDSNMHWNYKEDELILVEVASNYSIVELFLNGESLGARSMSESPDRLFRWVVPYKAGELTARAGFKGQEIEANLMTAGKASEFTLTSDKSDLIADAYDVTHLVVQLHDKKGRSVKIENANVKFDVQGPAKLLGVDNGAPDNINHFQSNQVDTAKGRALAIIQSTKEKGKIRVVATIKGFEPQILYLNSL